MPRKSQAPPTRQLDLLIGAHALAVYIFGVYPLKRDLGLFRLRGQICGRPETINQRIAEREKAA
jgi:hypothetical protein